MSTNSSPQLGCLCFALEEQIDSFDKKKKCCKKYKKNKRCKKCPGRI